ncbi:MAG: hypothetical protein IKP28_03585 [Clostridia bacterium]|nr:hypothetical protein [Clostridia bacterium]
MNYQNYEEYMRSVLGYNPNNWDTYSNYNPQNQMQHLTNMQEENQDLYPEIYKVIYPMVRKACKENESNEITEETVENLTNIVYTNIDIGDVEVSDNQITQQELRNGDVPNPRARSQQRETRQSRNNNPLLHDLIRILVLREFFDRRRPNRPPFPIRPGEPIGPRPPFPRYY